MLKGTSSQHHYLHKMTHNLTTQLMSNNWPWPRFSLNLSLN
jgi:hypothetical protein